MLISLKRAFELSGCHIYAEHLFPQLDVTAIHLPHGRKRLGIGEIHVHSAIRRSTAVVNCLGDCARERDAIERGVVHATEKVIVVCIADVFAAQIVSADASYERRRKPRRIHADEVELKKLRILQSRTASKSSCIYISCVVR